MELQLLKDEKFERTGHDQKVVNVYVPNDMTEAKITFSATDYGDNIGRHARIFIEDTKIHQQVVSKKFSITKDVTSYLETYKGKTVDIGFVITTWRGYWLANAIIDFPGATDTGTASIFERIKENFPFPPMLKPPSMIQKSQKSEGHKEIIT